MSAREKVLWVVNYNTVTQFLNKAVTVGATGVAIRSDNDVAKAIPLFKAKGIKVYAWRWPSSLRDPAMREAEKAAGLLKAGLDGYFVDPEGAPGKPYDWDRKGLEGLAADFCTTVTSAAPGKEFGTTSHYRAAAVFPNLPWATFFKHSTVLLPQAYWRSDKGTIGHGLPADNYKTSIEFWTKAGGMPEKIVPMGGELGSSTRADLETYVATATQANKTFHFYAYDSKVQGDAWAVVAAA